MDADRADAPGLDLGKPAGAPPLVAVFATRAGILIWWKIPGS